MKKCSMRRISAVLLCVLLFSAAFLTSCQREDADAAGDASLYDASYNGNNGDGEEEEIVEVTGVTLSKSAISLNVGSSRSLVATVAPADAVATTLRWASSDEGVATVQGGVVTAIGEGTAIITVTTANGKSATCEVTVSPLQPSGPEICSISIVKGDVRTLTPTIETETGETLMWESSDTQIVTVENGVITAVSAGKATVRVTASGGKSEPFAVTVLADGIFFRTLRQTGLERFGTLSNTRTSFAFAEEIVARGNASFALFSDAACEQKIESSTVELAVGNNIFYVLESHGDEPYALYTVTLRRKPIYTVFFQSNGGSAVAAQTIEEGGVLTLPANPTRTGYAFDGWSYDFTKPVTQDLTVDAAWTARSYAVSYDVNGGQEIAVSAVVIYDGSYKLTTPKKTGYAFVGWYYNGEMIAQSGTWQIADNVTLVAEWVPSDETVYRVEHYIEQLDGTYELKESEKLTGVSDSLVTPLPKDYPGFTAPAAQTVTVLADGTTCVRYDYTRNSYTITYDFTGGTHKDGVTQTVVFGAAYTLRTPSRAGYAFAGYAKDGDAFVAGAAYDIAQDIILIAEWQALFVLDGGTITALSEYGKSCAEIAVPAAIDGVAITAIRARAFYQCNALTTLTIADTLTSIGESAFEDCSKLASVIFGEESALVSLGSSAFLRCVALTAIEIPAGVTCIGNATFGACTALTSVVFDEGSALAEIGYAAFAGSLMRSFELPAGVTAIGDYAFALCSELQSLTFAQNSALREIGYAAFTGCTALTALVLPVGTTTVGAGAFAGCSLLATLTLPASVQRVGEEAFEDCPKLSTVYITDLAAWCRIDFDAADANPLAVGAKLYLNGTLVTVAEIPVTLQAIGNYAFYGYEELVAIRFAADSALTSIGVSAFEGCAALESIVIPARVSEIGTGAFAYCSALRTVAVESGNTVYRAVNNSLIHTASKTLLLGRSNVIPADGSVTSIAPLAFSGYTGLDVIVIPSAVTRIGNGAFAGCSALSAITLPFVGATPSGSENTHFGYIFGADAPAYNSSYVPASLESVTITSGSAIAPLAFYNCAFLKSVSIPTSVTQIGAGAFTSCRSLGSITLPFVGATSNGSTNTHFGYIFGADTPSYNNSYVPSSLQKVVILGGDEISSEAFCYCANIRQIRLPAGLLRIGNEAFSGCSSLTSVEIPASVTAIGERVFMRCAALAKIEVEIGNAVYHSEGNCLIHTASKALIAGCQNSVIPEDGSVKRIAPYAFAGCASLISITVPTEVTSIGQGAFIGCESLDSITLPFVGAALNGSTNTHFGYIFGAAGAEDHEVWVPSLSTVVITGGTAIAKGAFRACNLSSITLPFIGAALNGSTNTHFGYIFGADSVDYNDVYLPDTLRTVIITGGNAVAAEAFFGCDRLTSITLPASIRSIGDAAFCGCASMRTLTLSNGVIALGANALRDCAMLQTLSLPESITGIGEGAFYGCAALSALSIPVGVTQIGANTFYNCLKLQALSLPAGLISIGDRAFFNCKTLSTLVLPTTLTRIGEGAFYGCQSISALTVPADVTYIYADTFFGCLRLQALTFAEGSALLAVEDRAFCGCQSLSTLTIPATVKRIGAQVLQGCAMLQSITIPFVGAALNGSTNTHFGYIFGAPTVAENNTYVPSRLARVSVTGGSAIDAFAFCGCKNIRSVDLSEALTITAIGEDAFRDCSTLSSVALPDGITEIAANTFRNTSVQVMSLPDGVTKIGSGAFASCRALQQINFSENLTKIGDAAFENCGVLNDINLPSSVIEIGNAAFRNAALSLLSFAENSALAVIGDAAFENTYLTTVVVPANVTQIGKRAFYHCRYLASVLFETEVLERIGTDAFAEDNNLGRVTICDLVAWCSIDFANAYANPICHLDSSYDALYVGNELVTQLEIPNEVTVIKDYAFCGFGSLRTLTLPVTLSEIGSYAFYNCASLHTLVIDDEAELAVIGTYAFGKCTSLQSIEIPASLTSIGEYAFLGASGLVSINVDKNNPVYLGGGECLIERATKTLLLGCYISEIPEDGSVTSIAPYAFYYCKRLTEITLPASIKSIGAYAFYNCSELHTVTFAEGSELESIDEYAFYNCALLKKVILDCTEGWLVYPDAELTDGTELSHDDLADEAVIAQYLKLTYPGYWRRDNA